MSNQIPFAFQQMIDQTRLDLNKTLNGFAASQRQQFQQRTDQLDKRLSDLAQITKALKMSREQDDQIVRIEDIPGRRIPFDYTVDIPISNGDMSQREGTITISQEGPFVAVKRFCCFQSFHQFTVATSPTVSARFSGRSYGRWRPISSVFDMNDGQNQSSTVATTNPFTNGTFVGSPVLTSTQSGFRSMEFDGRIQLVDTGSSFPRQNDPVASPLWGKGGGDPTDLGCLDFFERGSVLSFKVQPTHVNNPAFGNADGPNIFGTATWPFLAGQFDSHEGIITPGAFAVAGSPSIVTRLGSDSVTRLPDGVITIGLIGYRILQPPGV